MRRFIVSLSVVVVLLLSLVATVDRGTSAQEATPDATAAMMATATHPVVGGWRFINDVGEGETFDSFGIFHADGTYTESTPDGVMIGVWRPTGQRTVDLTFHATDLDPDPEVLISGEGRMAAEINETGNTLTATFTFVAQAADGTVVFSGEGFQVTGSRLEVLPMVPLGTPMAGTPTS